MTTPTTTRSPWTRIEDATALFFADGITRVESIAAYFGWQAQLIERRRIALVFVAPETVEAHVNHGRWLVTCSCGRDAFTHPEWRIACCAECGAVYRGVVFPERREEIEALLLARPRRDSQNWEPGESVLRLKAENVLHRVAAQC